MSTAQLELKGPVARSVQEALSAVLAPDQARLVFDMALMFAQLGAVPEEASRARTFVDDSLRRAIESYVGSDAAESVVEGLEPILSMMGSHIRMRSDEPPTAQSGETATPLLPPVSVPIAQSRLILVSSLDRTSIQGIARQLFATARVRQIRNVFELLTAVEMNTGEAPVMVVDCSLPAVDPMTLATMLPAEIQEAKVVLWGATRRQRDELEKEAPIARFWVPCPSTTNHDQLAELLRSFL
ncbi:MAG: hypothetical protein JRH11_11410 [Deltaproteobacteria bacterium]|nr:hypothetical protein [Deltaproteobacteria bacterium]